MMKRVMTTSVVAGLLGALGFAPAVSAEGLYGSLRTGVIMFNPEGDGDTTWDIGNTGNTLGSRIGVKSSLELDGGMTAGVNIEKRLGDWSNRLQNVYLSGDFGTLTVGHQWGTFWNATTVDGSWFFGGLINGPTGFQSNGIAFSSSLGGPFNFSAMVKDNDSSDDVTMPGEDADFRGDGTDILEVSGTLDIAGAALSVGWQDVDDGNSTVRVRAKGDFGPLGYSIGGGTVDAPTGGDDIDLFGAWLSFAVTESGKAYIEYEDLDSDNDAADADRLTMGYTHTLAPGFQVIAEFRTPDSGPDEGAVALAIHF